MTWLVVIVLSGHAFISYDAHKTYDDCEKVRAAVESEAYVARCMTLEDALGFPSGIVTGKQIGRAHV